MVNKHLKGRILKLLRYWRPILDLENWVFYIHWGEKKILAGCEADPEYKQVHLYFNLPKIAKQLKGALDLEELVVHELTHSPLWLLSRGLKNRRLSREEEFAEENTTTTVSRALIRARSAGALRAKRRG